jgi:drug/metabolite transporter (DMT)-like permease
MTDPMKGLKIAGSIVAELLGLGCLLKIAFGMTSAREHALPPAGLAGYVVGFVAASAVSFFLVWSAFRKPPPTGAG